MDQGLHKRKGKHNDPFWDHVDKTNDISVCKYCHYTFAAGTSISRIKIHLSGVKGRGINICREVPSDVKEAAYQTVHKKQKTIPNSSNITPILSNLEVQEGSELPGGEMENWIQSMITDGDSFVAGQGEPSQWQGGDLSDMVGVENCSTEERCILTQDGGVSQGQGNDDISHVGVENLMQNVTITDESIVPEGPDIARIAKGEALLATKQVGQASERNMEKIWSWLMKDEVLNIGIYGMGGVGKTSLVTHIHNQLLQRPSSFDYVFWITVSQEFTITKLQYLIAKAISLDLSNEEDIKKRASKLSKALIAKGKIVLILDDLWNHFLLQEVGIPVEVNACKLILTTRSLEVCRRMGCQEKIKVELLTKEEAWTLFTEKLGHDSALSPEVEQIAKSVAEECGRLPLGIVTMAGSMRGVDDLYEWRNALTELKVSEVRKEDMEPEVFHILRFSYLRLNDSTLQQCLLYCAFFPEDYTVDREDLIGYLIDEGIIQPMKSRRAEYDKGQAMLNKLEYACLLESYISNEKYRCFKMHDLIRDMALQKLRENSPIMVEVREELKELPDEDEWKEDLVRVSLVGNRLKKITSRCSPMCPKLSTLLLLENIELEMIADSFFKHFEGLKVLDLSCSAIKELPGSFSDLVNLTAIYLRRCENLSYIPSLAKLEELRKLDLRYTALEELPQGMEKLSSLRYLNLHGNCLKELPAGILPNLTHLQFLYLNRAEGFMKTTRVEELACLKNLETLRYQFSDLIDLKKYLKSLEVRQPLTSYLFVIGELGVDPTVDYSLYMTPEEVFYKEVVLHNCNIDEKGGFLELPEDVSALSIGRCHDARSLCDVSPFKHATSLKSFLMWGCDGIECLVSMSESSPDLFVRLESLRLNTLNNFCVFIRRDSSAQSQSPSGSTFSHLKKLYISTCPSMKNLFSLDLLPNLKNLEVIEVDDCNKMEEIIVTEEEGMMVEESNGYNNNQYSVTNLPKLMTLKLSNLPGLKSICRGVVICGSIQEIVVVHCPKLKKLPIFLPPVDNRPLRRIQAYPREWWESVEWGNSNSKNIMQPLCVFRESLY